MTAPSPGLPLGGWDPDVTTAGPEWLAATADQRSDAIAAAVRSVWALTGRQLGVAEVTLAPWVPYIPPDYYRAPGFPFTRPYSPNSRYSGDRYRSVLLPGPVVEVREVLIAGLPMTEPEWALQLPVGRLVKRQGAWPSQDLTWPIFTVRYVRGTPVPSDANTAAGLLAYELLKARVGAKACALPARTREVSRAGISISMAAPEDLFAAGLTGVPAVDSFITSVNPTHSQMPSAVYSPDVTGAHRIVSVSAA